MEGEEENREICFERVAVGGRDVGCPNFSGVLESPLVDSDLGDNGLLDEQLVEVVAALGLSCPLNDSFPAQLTSLNDFFPDVLDVTHVLLASSREVEQTVSRLLSKVEEILPTNFRIGEDTEESREGTKFLVTSSTGTTTE